MGIKIKKEINTIRLAMFLIFFAVIGCSLSMSGLIGNSPKELECSEDVGECFETTVTRIIDGDTIVTAQDEKIRFSLSSAPELKELGMIWNY